MVKYFRNVLLVIANLFVSLLVTYVVITIVRNNVEISLMEFILRTRDITTAVFTALFLDVVTQVAAFGTSSWIFASHFARDDRRGHLAVVWGISAVVIVSLLILLLS